MTASRGAQAGGPGSGVFPGSQLPRWGRTWEAVALAGLVTFALGLVLLVWPHATVVAVAALIGVALLVTGILQLVQAITAAEETGGKRAGHVIIGVLAVLAGLYCLRHLGVTIALLAFIVGLFWAVHGIVDIMAAATSRAEYGRSVTALTGVLSLAAGLILMFWPAISLAILGVILGIWLICYGVLLAFLAFQLRAVVRAAVLARGATPGPPGLEHHAARPSHLPGQAFRRTGPGGNPGSCQPRGQPPDPRGWSTTRPG